jgi:anthranilate phosphoribosyltransferase
VTGTGFARFLTPIADGETLSRDDAREAMNAIMDGKATHAQIGAFLMGLRARGETADEIAGAADSMRAHAVTIRSARTPLLDTCGTGGDGTGTFNISTAAAFVVAGAGTAVAKHGNRSVSSRCGSADVLEALGARIDLPPDAVADCLEATGVGFLFAPLHHGAMHHAAPVRQELGVRTLFNLLGPLCNPAGATHQLLGVFDPHRTKTMARVLGLLGSEGAMVVHGEDGLDEISLAAPTRVSAWRDGRVTTYTMTPEDAGLARGPLEAIRGGDAGRNAVMIQSVLADEAGPARDIVLLNAGAALAVADQAADLAAGVERARESIASGKARAALDAFVRFTTSREA